MSECARIEALLAWAAAGVLDAAEEREVAEHTRGCAPCAARLEELRGTAGELSGLPYALPSPELLVRTHAMIASELAVRAEERWTPALLVALSLFGWVVTLASLAAWRLLSGGTAALLDTGWSAAAWWMGASSLLAWMTAGSAALLLGRNARPGRRLV